MDLLALPAIRDAVDTLIRTEVQTAILLILFMQFSFLVNPTLQ